MTELAELVAEMRALGVLEYEREGVRIKLGPAPLPHVERETVSADERKEQDHRMLLGRLLGAASTRPKI